MKTLNDYMDECFKIANEKGWWRQYSKEQIGSLEVIKLTADEILSKLMLIVSEVSEATEEAREKDFNPRLIKFSSNGKPEGFGIEIMDVIIRSLDLLGALGCNSEQLYQLKTEYNKTRPDRHGGKRA